jgi:hypothetical protein
MEATMRGNRRDLVEGLDRPQCLHRAARPVFAMLAGVVETNLKVICGVDAG